MWRVVQAQERLALRRADRILAISPYTVERIKTLVPEVADRVELVSVPVDTEYFTPDETTRDRSVAGDYLLLTARINDPRKNVAMLLHAFKTINERFPNLRLVLAGDEPNGSMQTLVDNLGLTDAVDFPGMVTRDELRRLYQGAQLFTLSSTQEGLGIVVMEAIACGTPVISTRCGGPEGVIVDGETGRLVPNGDADAFAQAVIDLLSQPDHLSRMQHDCVAYALEHFATATVEKQLFTAMQHVFHEHTARLPDPPVKA